MAQRVVVMGKGRVLSEGSVDALRSQVPLTRIRCVTDLDADHRRNWPQVASAEREGQRMHISTDAAENVLRRLLDADASLSELEVQRAGLAEAFTELTREEHTEKIAIKQEAA